MNTAMNRKLLNDLAARLLLCKPHSENKYATLKAKHIATDKMEQWREMVKEMASFCNAHNRNFDRDHFFTACGLD
jgi:hypothetical protein